MKTFKRSSGVLVKKGNQVLLCKRAPNQNFERKWSIPMGGIEGDETPINAAHREFFEETNLKIDVDLKLIGFINKYTKESKTKRGIVYVYLLENEDDKFLPDLENAKDGHEHTECKYFDKNKMPLDEKNEDLIKIIEKILK